MKPFVRRAYERRTNLNRQLCAAVDWWRSFLASYTPRNIPVSIMHERPVISYSDGEGTGGVGFAVWVPNQRPVAAFLKVPVSLRML